MKGVHVIYETHDFIAVNKPSGILSIPDRFDDTKFSLYKYLQSKYDQIYIIHRLDKETSGLILFAKNANTHAYFSEIFEKRKVVKYYLGIVVGSLTVTQGNIHEAIAEHQYHKGVMVLSKKGKPSVTHFEVLQDFGIFSLVKFQIETGRTHQIRVHMKYAGHPIVADTIYGDGKPVMVSSFKKKYRVNKDEEERPLLNRLALHSFQLKFQDNSGEQRLLECELAKDMKALSQQLKKNRK
ncbi:RluA family pseudouridine synthase [soil metagenome]